MVSLTKKKRYKCIAASSITLPWFVFRTFALFATAKSPVSFQLHCTFIGPNHIVESILSFALIGPGPLKTLLLVDISDQLTIRASPKSPP